jgi:hypothetical protein
LTNETVLDYHITTETQQGNETMQVNFEVDKSGRFKVHVACGDTWLLVGSFVPTTPLLKIQAECNEALGENKTRNNAQLNLNI